MSITNVEVKKNNNENSLSLIRRFTKRAQSSGAVARVRSLRWNQRKPSSLKTKASALLVLTMRKKFELLAKLGKIIPKKKKYGRR